MIGKILRAWFRFTQQREFLLEFLLQLLCPLRRFLAGSIRLFCSFLDVNFLRGLLDPCHQFVRRFLLLQLNRLVVFLFAFGVKMDPDIGVIFAILLVTPDDNVIWYVSR